MKGIPVVVIGDKTTGDAILELFVLLSLLLYILHVPISEKGLFLDEGVCLESSCVKSDRVF